MLPLILFTIILAVFIIFFIFCYKNDYEAAGIFSLIGVALNAIIILILIIEIITSSNFHPNCKNAKAKIQIQYNQCISLIEAYKVKQDIRYPEVIEAISEYNILVKQNQQRLESIWYKDFTYDFYSEMPLIDYPKIS